MREADIVSKTQNFDCCHLIFVTYFMKKIFCWLIATLHSIPESNIISFEYRSHTLSKLKSATGLRATLDIFLLN